MQQLFIAAMIVFTSMSSAMAQTNPVCVYPQWLWAQTGGIYHYYSEYAFDNGDTTTPKMACQYSYWDNWSSGSGDENTNVGCAYGEAPCEYGGVGAKRAAPPNTLWGPEELAKKGYSGKLRKPGLPFFAVQSADVKSRENSPRFIVKINEGEEGAEVSKFYVLFDYEVSAKRKKKGGGGMPMPQNEPRSVTARFGLEVSESADAIVVPQDQIRKIYDRDSDELSGVFLLDLGRRTFVVRRHAGDSE